MPPASKISSASAHLGLLGVLCLLHSLMPPSVTALCWLFTLEAALLVFLWYRYCGSLFDPCSLFLYSAVVFNGGQLLLEPLGLNDHGVLAGRFDEHLLISSIWLVIFGIAAFQTGALAACFAMGFDRRISSSASPDERLAHAGYAAGLLLFAVGALPHAATLLHNARVSERVGYSALYTTPSGGGAWVLVDILGRFALPGCLLLIACGARRKNSMAPCWAGAFLFLDALMYLYLGQRGPAGFTIVATLWLIHYAVRPLPKKYLITAALLLLIFAFPLVRAVRGLSANERLELSTLAQAYFSIENPFIASLSEMGSSMITIAYTLQLVPRSFRFEFGGTYLYSLFSIVPNFLWDVHLASEFGHSGRWLMDSVNPWLAARGSSYGYSFIAEAYRNFGPFALAALLLQGALYGAFVSWGCDKRYTPRSAILACFLSYMLFFARGETLNIARPLVWYCLGAYLLTSFLAHLRKRA